MRYYFDWDPGKAKANLRHHSVSFEQASGVLHDPLAVTVFDEAHSEDEDRWATIGADERGTILVLSHTFKHIGKNIAKVRIISARKATRREVKQYKENNR